MKWMTAAIALMGTIGLVACLGAVFQTQDQNQVQQDNKRFMFAKMRYAKNIVEGLALENYDTLQESAQNLILISNDSNWNVFQTEDYLTMSRDFRGSANRLRQAAEDKNVDAATLAYFELTLNCVRCHKYVRQRNE